MSAPNVRNTNIAPSPSAADRPLVSLPEKYHRYFCSARSHLLLRGESILALGVKYSG